MAKKTNSKTSKKSGGDNSVVAVDIQNRELGEILSEKYLSYALSTIMSRSLPDVRDGLKPVHRRVLYAMYQLNLKPETPPKKSARIVGDVIGKYHPHGDSSIYDAMVRLAQDFAVRYPLVDGQGNFGNIDGDNAAAMRYTEARLTKVAQLLLEDIDQDTVDFRATYDGETVEPVVMPANFPNLLANGSSGIAVGMATNIPPHNVAELCDALDLLIENKECEVKDLLKFVKGPDFPTGGILAEDKAVIRQAYETGRGSLRVRAVWHKEEPKKGDGWQIVITEIPYQVVKSRLIEKIAELIVNKKLPFLDDITDESAEDVRIVLTPKNKTIEPELLMAQLYKNTDLETRFSLNMNVLDRGLTPRVMNLKEVLQAFIDHRQDVLLRRSRHRLTQIDHRLEVLGGLLVAYLNIDEVIKIIREEDDPKAVMMKRFKLSDVQVEAILNMRLRSLRKLEEIEIRREDKELRAEKAELEKLIASHKLQMKAISAQVARIREAFAANTPLGKRRTQAGKAPVDIDVPVEAFIEKEPITVICSDKGWIRAMKGHLEQEKIDAISYKDGDGFKFAIPCETTDKLVVFGTNGKFYTLACDKLPSGRGFGEPVRLMIDLSNEADIVTIMKHEPARKLLVAADDGRGFVVPEKEILSQTKNGKQCLMVKGGVEARVCFAVEPNHDQVATIGQNRKLLVFPLDQVPEMTKGVGVILQRHKDGGLSDAKTFRLKDGLTWYSAGKERVETNLKAWRGERAQAGVLPPNGFPRANKFSGK
ncbi:MAG: DNA topoisomerase IV subunit A [Alphaproteobacteria bacterium]|nr:DNA topoisomerase IV subunit A [Alphaproteobacteria bacterium]